MKDVDYVMEWLSKHGSIPELEFIPNLTERDIIIYQSYEINRYNMSRDGIKDNIEDELKLTENYFIRVEEYDYDSKDKCLNCGYFEKNEYSNYLIGYCSKFGEDINPITISCDIRIFI